MQVLLVLVSLLAASASAGTLAGPSSPAESFAQLALDFCAPAASQPGTDITELARSIPGLRLHGPKPFAEATGVWSDPLKKIMEASADTRTYWATTEISDVGAFHLAYVLADGSSCVVLAQDMPDVAALTLERIDSAPGFRLDMDGKEARMYAHYGTAPAVSFTVITPAHAAKSGVERIFFKRDPDVRPNVTDEDRARWAGEVLRVCVDHAQQRRAPALEDFGEFMELHTGTDGKSHTIGSPLRYPATVLFPRDGRGSGCHFTLFAGDTENPQVIALWRSALRDLAAKPGVGARGGERFTIPKVRGEKRTFAVRVEISAHDPALPMRFITVSSD